MISHAACKGHAPENTLAGVRAALEIGVDAIEIDVHASADGTPVLMHDATVDRTTDGTGAVAALTLAEIRRLNAGSRDVGGVVVEPVPTLAEALAIVRGRCLLIVEIKAEGIERRVVDAIAGSASGTMVWSFHAGTVARVRQLAPSVPCALLSPPLDGPPLTAAAALFETALLAGVQAVALHHASVDAGLVRAAALRGLTVFAWTVDTPDDQRRAAAAGVAGIVSNVPDLLATTLRP